MVAVDTVAAGVFMVADFLAMLDSLRQVGSRVRVVMMVGIERLMGVGRMRRGMGRRDGRSVADWVYRVGVRRFIIAGLIGDAGMGMG
jgi:hypothetical protein